MSRPTLCPPSAFPERVDALKTTGIAELSPIQTVTARVALARLAGQLPLLEGIATKPVLIHAPNGRPYLALLLPSGASHRCSISARAARCSSSVRIGLISMVAVLGQAARG